jgi:hypothetical protein
MYLFFCVSVARSQISASMGGAFHIENYRASQKKRCHAAPQQQQEFYVFYWQLDGMRNNNNKSGRVSLKVFSIWIQTILLTIILCNQTCRDRHEEYIIK